MRICKYCGSLIEGEPVMNPDKDGNGYHHFCLVDKEFRERDKSIFQEGYDKGKADVLDKIRTEIAEQVLESLSDGGDDWFAAEKVNECLEIIDKYKAESVDE